MKWEHIESWETEHYEIRINILYPQKYKYQLLMKLPLDKRITHFSLGYHKTITGAKRAAKRHDKGGTKDV